MIVLGPPCSAASIEYSLFGGFTEYMHAVPTRTHTVQPAFCHEGILLASDFDLSDRLPSLSDWMFAVGSLDSSGTGQLHFENADALVHAVPL